MAATSRPPSRLVNLNEVIRQDPTSAAKLLAQAVPQMMREYGRDQVEHPEALIQHLKTPGSWTMLLDVDDRGHVKGGASYGIYNGRGVIDYLWGSKDSTPLDLRRIHDATTRHLQSRHPKVKDVFIELTDPSRVGQQPATPLGGAATDAAKAQHRLNVFSALGYRALHAPYAQPSLGPGKMPQLSTFLAHKALPPTGRLGKVWSRPPKEALGVDDYRKLLRSYFGSWMSKAELAKDPVMQEIETQLLTGEWSDRLRYSDLKERPASLDTPPAQPQG